MRAAWVLWIGLQPVFLSLAVAQAADFLSAAPDIPLAEGVVEIADGALVFDKPQGRIVQLTALRAATIARNDVVAFYRRSLPNLGWRLDEQAEHGWQGKPGGDGPGDGGGGLTFSRKGEILRISFAADLVIFDLTPSRP